MGGSYLIVTKNNISDKTIESSLKDIKSTYPDSYILFSSKDKFIEDNYSINIEQDLSNNVFSSYISSDLVLLDYLDKKEIINYDKALEKDSDVLIDNISKKIYIAGKKLSSKDINSQKVASELLVKLLYSDNDSIYNDELNYSSYRENKNEMSGKIVYPLIKLVKSRLNKIFGLEISGKLSEYELKLDPSNLKIFIINKVNHD